MSNTPFPPIIPGGDAESDGGADATREVDGGEVLDTDANDELIDSADADALASTDPDEQMNGGLA